MGAYLVGAVLVLGIGIMDDVLELRAMPKLFTQSIASTIAVWGHPTLGLLFMDAGVPLYIGYPLAVLWMMSVINAFSLIDGLDGLCTGITALAAVTLFLVCPEAGLPALLAPALAGAASGFLTHNYSPARIFLGDSGNLLIGFTLATLSLDVPITGSLAMSMGVLIFAFGFPLLDAFFVLRQRGRQRRPLFADDRSHLYHRLHQLGLSERQVLWVLLALQGYCGVASVLLASALPSDGWQIAVLALPLVYVFVRWLTHTESLLSFQTARRSFLSLGEEFDQLGDLGRIRAFIHKQAGLYDSDGVGFSIALLDMSSYENWLTTLSPSRSVKFQLALYGTLKARLRETDLIARPHETMFAVILPGAWEIEGRHSPIFHFLRSQLMRIQDEHGIPRNLPTEAEGFRVLTYPQDRVRIWSALGIDRVSAPETPSSPHAA